MVRNIKEHELSKKSKAKIKEQKAYTDIKNVPELMTALPTIVNYDCRVVHK